MTKRERIINKLEKAYKELSEAIILLRQENTEGKQFDYVNSPRLADSFDNVNRIVKQMDKIVYQGE